MKSTLFAVTIVTTLSTIAQATTSDCYNGGCGCPGSFKETWCNENSIITGWCAESESRCTGCGGAWCHDSETNLESDDYDGPLTCFIHNCECPGSFINNWCTVDNAKAANEGDWCHETEDNCENHCSGKWCGGSSSTPSPSSHPVVPPIPSPTAHPVIPPVPAPTAHPVIPPVPAPTAHPIIPPVPAPTAQDLQDDGYYGYNTDPYNTPVPPVPAPTPATGGKPTNGGRTCFSSEDRLTLESGRQVSFAQLKIGDSVLSADRDGVVDYSKVVFLPHGENDTPTTFLKVITEKNKEIKLTRGHLVQLCNGQLLPAHLLAPNDSCLRTIDGEEQITSIEQIVLNGIYTAVAEKEFLVVNGIVASPFASSATLAHAFFNLTDVQDWCSSHNWMVYENLNHQPLVDVMEAYGNPVHPSQDCMNLITNMFEQFKDEPVGWGVNGWGYRGWINPVSKKAHGGSDKHAHLRSTERRLEELTKVPIAGILSQWE